VKRGLWRQPGFTSLLFSLPFKAKLVIERLLFESWDGGSHQVHRTTDLYGTLRECLVVQLAVLQISSLLAQFRLSILRLIFLVPSFLDFQTEAVN
jgi:hypothetical protein